MQYALAFVVPLVVSLLLVPPFVKLAIKFGFTDKPTERKIHDTPKPLTGGVVMFAAFAPAFASVAFFYDKRLFAVLAGCVMILGIGLVDDFYKTRGRDFKALPRFISHIAAAVLTFAVGIRFTGFFNPFSDLYVTFPIWLQFLMTALWIVGLVTVINFMDGLDGLAGGLSILSGATLFVVAIVKGQTESALIAAALVGAAAGFLRYNLPPSKLIMGDSGAYLLGYLLAVISLLGAFKQATLISVFIPVLAMGVPIFDNLLVTFRRIRAKKPVYEADTVEIPQLHYRLLKRGMKPTHAVAFILLLGACLNLTSIIILLISN
ncbi:MAG: undecaprenyl/decaprenyl-phosphate alpha-N-acetylglucosaminyl 1-phosphate transferase [Defluviitaleaceae bacterium]|nr:undecaprenyl/decaprenyl-phosphate alpha-N-acetylglucosaminyl 1-phosphate transferase [Defluviitaleaceae bacterium]